MLSGANVLSYLDEACARTPQALAVVDARASFTYAEHRERCRRVGSALAARGACGKQVIVAMEKGCDALCAMMGALYAGAAYVPVDLLVPLERLDHIVQTLEGALYVTDELRDDHAKVLARHGMEALRFADLVGAQVEGALLATARAATLESDPAYILFTSGSTGVPKGVAISHRAILSFIDVFVPTLGIRASDRLANQAPFDFDVSTKDIYSCLATGATLVVVDRELFMQPTALVSYLSEQRVTVLVWAVAALCIASTYHALDARALATIRIVAFSGEVMPLKHLRAWRDTLPQATFFNLYGPTEITCNCLYHELEPGRSYDEGIPLGECFAHCGVFLLGKDDEVVEEPGEVGEIVVRGPSVALGYVGLPEQTAAAFTENPVPGRFFERIYRTGDLAARSAEGELFFRGRKDNQIKYLGHRVELEEVDLAVERFAGVRRCRCVFDERRKRLLGFFEGEANEADVRVYVAERLPTHMRPAPLRKVSEMPLTKNGKVDRAALLAMSACRPRRKEG